MANNEALKKYASSLGVSVENLSFDQLSDFVKSNAASSVSHGDVKNVYFWQKYGYSINWEKARRVLLQAINENRGFACFRVTYEGVYYGEENFPKEDEIENIQFSVR